MIFSACGSYGQETPLLKSVAHNYDGSINITTSFDLAIFWKIREKKEIKHGTIILAPGDKFNVTFGTGQWVSDGKTFWQYDNKLSQVVISTVASIDRSALPSGLIAKYLSNYPLEEKSKNKNVTVFQGSAGNGNSTANGEAQKVVLTVDNKNASISQLFVIDKSGNESAYSFHATAFRAQNPSVFSFSPPKGARIIDQR